MEQPFRILLADELDADSEERLSAAGELLRERNCTEEALCRAIRGCDGFVVRTHVKVTRRVLEAGAKLKVVGVAGVGTDNVDVRAAEELGIRILHTPAASSDAVAEFTVGLMLNLQRGIARLAEAYRRGGFAGLRRRTYGDELCEQTIGIIGMGRIGSRVGRICSAGFGARVLYNDIIDVGPFPFEAKSVSKEVIWAESDFVTLHVPATDLTRGLAGVDAFHRMKPTASLINAARGVVVDTQALTAALSDGRIAGAALDVVDPEPLPPEHPLFAMENCILTPHVAARTRGGLQRMYAVADEVVAFLRKGDGERGG